ncbi:hypothetical protein M441DRAFT_53119 [Trichoderma asperellum CBS 433.97]|uniref:Secreted protein n=1 Tax=Trichoderma asperellum (strain ATCC 204424 / CBS 433.97 / NBRC 101777) TaxID=1042311 RepID=A0A2T3ZNK9_TRIA4|nr:hypothetical protein M441DRAFT_53119 [Trichoderma asperellum CBS 433.97]PTB46382.1 hypothetical protein M441DRAFT_53119 [Trichoderma asperellum CBS 433.97]
MQILKPTTIEVLTALLCTALFVSARAAKPSQVEACVRVWGRGRHLTRPQKHTFLSLARKMNRVVWARLRVAS